MGCHLLLHGNCPTQGSKPGLPHCRQILDCLSHQGNPWIQTTDIIPVISGIALLWAVHMNVHCYVHVSVMSLAECLLETGPMLAGHRESSQYMHIGKLTERFFSPDDWPGFDVADWPHNSIIFTIFLFFKYLFMYFILAALGFCCCTLAFSRCREWGYSLAVVCRLPTAAASLVAEHGL